ncbi:MAG: arginine--tRNA ligase [Candidatus Nealsonbacteria bacterium]|nr:arginine--tRNA ligase [Candidatus Nealsonbacteria bacterium]
MIREKIRELVENSCKNLFSDKAFRIKIDITRTSQKEHGDYTANVRGLAVEEQAKIVNYIKKLPDFKGYFSDVKFENPIFINFFLSANCLQDNLKEILKQKNKFGNLKIGKNKKINVEFVSANPTGPLTLGNGRGGFCGDVLTSILNKSGFKAKREYYVNDTGEQIRKLGHSVIGDDQAVYKGEYINELKEKIKGSDPERVGKKAAKMILNSELLGKEWGIKKTIKEMGIEFDAWFSEESLYKNKEVDKVLDYLKNKGLTFEREGALWFKSTQFGDDKDRVLVKSSNEKTYIASDIAYLKNKFERNFEKLIFFWGADHHGYINRIKSAAEALGYKKEQVEIIIMQMVSIIWSGQNLRMSKREGVYKTLQELIEGLGPDVVRFFFLTRNPSSQLIFDFDLAKEKSEKNPVYYIQYAHARICSIIKKIKTSAFAKASTGKQNLKLLIHPSELELIKELIRFPEIVEDIAKNYQIQRIPQHASDLAAAFHKFYKDCRVISKDKELTRARLSLVLATKIVLKNSLDLMGISAPEEM